MKRAHAAVVAIASLLCASRTGAQTAKKPVTRTQIIFLGTGTPYPSPESSGPATAVVVNGTAYLVDAGTGVVRRAKAASLKGIPALDAKNLRIVFITHLHSDHTIGLPDLIFTPWIMHRTAPLEVYGPPGIKAMTDHILAAWKDDNDIRINGLEHGNTTGYKVNAHEIGAGVVYRDSNVTVKSFLVPHGSWPEALGYRFETKDRTIVFSGDTHPSDAIVENCNGCDVLIHEVYSERGYADSDSAWRKYSKSFHTSTTELAAIATRARPKMLILYHQMYFSHSSADNEKAMLAEIRKHYKGVVVSAHDLDVR
jgi:ribonuclease BN (tRNA processing enzyme)